MLTRREWLRLTAAAGAGAAAFSLNPRLLEALGRTQLMTRPIPSTGEELPIIGLGSSATFASIAGSDDTSRIRDVLRTMVDLGGTVFDTAPSYAGGASEEAAGRLAAELGISETIFWATKLNVARQGSADPAAARAQVEQSFERIGLPVVDCIQVHNLGDPPVQLGILKELKEEGRIRYIGITSTSESRYPDLAEVMRNEPLDFIGVDYAVDNRSAEDVILPLAQERGIGVMVYAPFGRTRLWDRVEGREVPEWAREFGADSWARFFLKFITAHPAVTVITPATSRPEHMIDNLGGGMGRVPDDSEVARVVEYVEALPDA